MRVPLEDGGDALAVSFEDKRGSGADIVAHAHFCEHQVGMGERSQVYVGEWSLSVPEDLTALSLVWEGGGLSTAGKSRSRA